MKREIILDNIEIEAVAAEGKALAKVDGMALFVPFAVPGDIVKVKLTKKRKAFMEGFILELKKPSAFRQEAFCPYFSVCGGCKWQPLPYGMQLEAKRQQVEDQLVRIGHLNLSNAVPAPDGKTVLPTIPSDKTSFYRNKLEFTFSERRWLYPGEDPDSLSPAEKCGLGFHVGRFFDKVLDIKECFLQPSPSNEIRNFIRSYALNNALTFFNIREHKGFLRNIVIRNNSKGDVMLTVVFSSDDKTRREDLLDAVAAQFPRIMSLYYVINPKANDSIADLDCILYKGEDAIYEEMEGLRFKIGPKSFYQTNSDQAHKLYDVVRKAASLKGNEVVYDLYTGTGTIAQFICSKASKVIGIEYVPEAIKDAETNSAANGIHNCEFVSGDMKQVLTDKFIEEHGHPDVVILDPPRAGIHPDVAKVIVNSSPERIVYVSCNPASQARDLSYICSLAEEKGDKYSIVSVQPVDMFPHTHHVENVVSLIKS